MWQRQFFINLEEERVKILKLHLLGDDNTSRRLGRSFFFFPSPSVSRADLSCLIRHTRGCSETKHQIQAPRRIRDHKGGKPPNLQSRHYAFQKHQANFTQKTGDTPLPNSTHKASLPLPPPPPSFVLLLAQILSCNRIHLRAHLSGRIYFEHRCDFPPLMNHTTPGCRPSHQRNPSTSRVQPS